MFSCPSMCDLLTASTAFQNCPTRHRFSHTKQVFIALQTSTWLYVGAQFLAAHCYHCSSFWLLFFDRSAGVPVRPFFTVSHNFARKYHTAFPLWIARTQFKPTAKRTVRTLFEKTSHCTALLLTMAPTDFYDDDDLYDGNDYEEDQEEELSPEDKQAMEEGTADVKKALGANASKVTVKQIQEALWHYYYDVEKSAAYLTKTFIAPPPPKPAPRKAPETGKKTTAPVKAASTVVKKDKNVDTVFKDADVANGVSNLRVSDAPPPKSKGLDVAKEYEKRKSKKSISFVVVGHVDAGKSTLMGRLLLELKYVQERTVDRYRRQAEKTGKQSFALAWVMDQRTEERERGVTIDIATNHFETPNTNFTILDAPGHRDFVPNMIAGASQADFAVLVVDANTGAYEKGLKGQTREHVLLLRSLGVQRLIVAVNKLDMVGWSKDRFDEISQQVMGFLTGLGFQSKLVSFIPISGLNGDNIAKKTEDASATWYQGPTLLASLEDSEPSSARAITKPFRMSISEVFRSQQQGTTTLAGRIDAGNIQIGDAVIVQPSGERAYIKSIMVDTEAQEWAVAGQSVTIALTDIDPVHIRVGDIVCSTVDPISVGDTFTLKAMAFEHLMPMPVDLHRGRLHAAGQIESIPATLDKATGEVIKKKPKVIQPGSVARVTIKLGTKVPLEKGQRVVLRSGGETVAAGLLE